MLHKIYRAASEGPEVRYSRAVYMGTKRAVISVAPHYKPIAIHYMYYNFARIHPSLRMTPAMEAGVADDVWSIDEIIDLLD